MILPLGCSRSPLGCKYPSYYGLQFERWAKSTCNLIYYTDWLYYTKHR